MAFIENNVVVGGAVGGNKGREKRQQDPESKTGKRCWEERLDEETS